MQRLKPIFALLMLVVWLPGTSHALLEFGGLIHQPHPAESSHHDGDQDHNAADGLCTLPSHGVQLAKEIPSAVLVSIFHSAIDTCTAPVFSRSFRWQRLGPSPPVLLNNWQFILRAALSERAPSFIS